MNDRSHDPLAVTTVDTIEDVSGTYPGYRRVHARGLCFDATFTPSGEAAALTTAAHLQSAPTPVVVRFSNSNTNPTVHDGVRAGRGLAARFLLPDGTATDLVSVNVPVFFAATPGQFLEFLGALRKDPATGAPDPAKVRAYATAHPTAALALQEAGRMPIPVSYGTVRYWAVHAFVWVDPQGERRPVRYRWEPDTGLRELTEQEAADKDPEYLAEELVQRLADGPVGFTLHVQLGQEGDPTDDPTRPWPADRPEIVAGHLRITAPVADQEHWAAQVYDPTRITPGIELSDDPVLAFRSRAYAVSYERREASAGR
ncbi:catalase family peroxidase [Streptomyces sp. NRRL S-31]|uniref:catalase family peroxidase n=1 Tax=Streptomyces sp. NRRL S-31 TaxID=1463898 RepID=UPI000568190F|nr:catalase family peroxidase [Streptomyces sp. NRRL S-31]